VSIASPYSIYVGVAGYKGVTRGDFELVIDLKTAPAEKTGAITKVGRIPVAVGKRVTVQGKLVLYRFEQPADTTLTVKVTPKNPALDVSLYVYRVGAGDTTTLPPKVYSAKCEASFGKSDALISPNPGDPESIDGMITVGNPYTVYVGVAGARGVTAGEYALEVDLTAR